MFHILLQKGLTQALTSLFLQITRASTVGTRAYKSNANMAITETGEPGATSKPSAACVMTNMTLGDHIVVTLTDNFDISDSSASYRGAELFGFVEHYDIKYQWRHYAKGENDDRLDGDVEITPRFVACSGFEKHIFDQTDRVCNSRRHLRQIPAI